MCVPAFAHSPTCMWRVEMEKEKQFNELNIEKIPRQEGRGINIHQTETTYSVQANVRHLQK